MKVEKIRRNPKWRISTTLNSRSIERNIQEVNFERKNLSFVPIITNKGCSVLNLSYNNIKSIERLETLEYLEVFKLTGTQIGSLFGVKEQPLLKKLYVSKTPLSSLSNYRIMCAIVFGENVEEIDSVPLTQKEINFISQYGEDLKPFLVEGWIIMSTNPIRLLNPETRQRKVYFVDQNKLSPDPNIETKATSTNLILQVEKESEKNKQVTKKPIKKKGTSSIQEIPKSSIDNQEKGQQVIESKPVLVSDDEDIQPSKQTPLSDDEDIRPSTPVLLSDDEDIKPSTPVLLSDDEDIKPSTPVLLSDDEDIQPSKPVLLSDDEDL